ncbi:hypothetical protein EI77_04275 [Prosthecobacter fusiformis]|uniref:Uncharacterized protein n=1 Tax=Prosthecobacter fusiformis TaxID=48464 RepID=A0A4R7RJ52_9BACT|nr:hypothetical protein EI77_04275 [Prosthecobacter fusiformis]
MERTRPRVPSCASRARPFYRIPSPLATPLWYRGHPLSRDCGDARPRPPQGIPVRHGAHASSRAVLCVPRKTVLTPRPPSTKWRGPSCPRLRRCPPPSAPRHPRSQTSPLFAASITTRGGQECPPYFTTRSPPSLRRSPTPRPSTHGFPRDAENSRRDARAPRTHLRPAIRPWSADDPSAFKTTPPASLNTSPVRPNPPAFKKEHGKLPSQNPINPAIL